jgi:hypothetical protein
MAGGTQQSRIQQGNLQQTDANNPMLVLVSGILLLGGIAAFIGWGLSHAYPAG